MSKNNYNIFQKLTRRFGFQKEIDNIPQYSYSKDEILKTNSKEELEQAKLLAQQTKYIQDHWQTIDRSTYNQTLYYEPNRLSAYYDYESMEFSLHGDTKIATIDGYVTIKELAEKGRDYNFIVYSYDHNLKKVKQALAKNAHMTRHDMTYKITFSDEKHIIASLEHRLLKRNGVFCKVKDLKIGDSMMPFIRKNFYSDDNDFWIYSLNNKLGKNGWIPEFEFSLELDKNKKEDNINFISWDDLVNISLRYNTQEEVANHFNINLDLLNQKLKNNGFNDWDVFKKTYENKNYNEYNEEYNYIIKNIEEFGVVPVYDLTVPGYKNFATDTIFSHNTPEISAALDIYSEEATTISEKGQILTIYSESKRIKEALEDLFYNVLDINTNLQMWTRGVCKYGDNFVFLKVLPEKGIVGCQQLPNIEIERIEGASSTSNNIIGNGNPKDQTRELRFVWKTKDVEFQSWEIAHFRLLGDDRKLPYGTSILDKIRRIWKQLLLAEDAMLIYRTTRAPERRVFKVFVGNMDDKDIDAYVQKVANKFKRDPVVDQKTGQVDMRFNQMSVEQDFFIPVRDITQSSPIETLEGAKNLSEIADIEYIQKKLLAALRIPKAFIGFEENVGDGKNLALLDVRFSRTINRIQKSLIQELNKIALIHLFLLGFEDELNNFSLSLTNPSSQSDLLKVEQWKEKIGLYKDATSDQSQLGILPVSHTWAKKNILGMSDNDILLDLQQQRLERALGFELTNTQNIIKRSGVFDVVDEKYGIPEKERQAIENSAAATETDNENMDGFSGGDFDDTGTLNEDNSPILLQNKKNNNIDDLTKIKKIQKNIYEINNKLKTILEK